MDATTSRDRWRNAFLYALVTTIMVLSVATLLSATMGRANQQLAERVDRNAAITEQNARAIICILQLGLDQKDSPPRNRENVTLCIADPDWINK